MFAVHPLKGEKMKILIEAYDKYGLQVLGNSYGQGFIDAKQYKRTKRYKNLKNLAGDRIEQYRIMKSIGASIYDPSYELLEILYI